MGNIQIAPERIAMMLADSHDSIVASYWHTQEAIEQIERPCWLVFVEDASYENTTVNQDLVDQAYSIAYVGQVFSGAGSHSFTYEYEKLAREVADTSVQYMLEHPQLQMSDRRGLQGGRLRGLSGVLWSRVERRSGISLFTRDAVSAEAFWGFTIDLTVKHQLAYETVGF